MGKNYTIFSNKREIKVKLKWVKFKLYKIFPERD